MAVDRNPDVMEMVEEALREDPDVSNSELKERAAGLDSDIRDLSARQFNARYPLQVKRQLSQEEEAESRKAGNSGESDGLRDTVRQNLLDFAKAVAGAEDRGKVIDVMRNVDNYVDNVMDKA